MSDYDVAVVGGGISGASLTYALARYTDVESVALIEKAPKIAPLNSDALSNSQTLHAGDIETNYDREKAEHVKPAADMVVGYGENIADDDDILHPMQKMVLGVGEEDKQQLEERYDAIKDLYPSLETIDREELEEVEPAVVDGRDPDTELFALYNPDGHAVDYGRLSESFVRKAADSDTDISVKLGTAVQAIEEEADGYTVDIEDGTVEADAVAVTAGTHSLKFAHDMGYGEDLTVLPVAGSFYYGPDADSEKGLNGKVYTVQNPKLPFAAIHGDPDIVNGRVRFGPTAKVVPFLERGNYRSGKTFAEEFSADRNVMSVFKDLVKESDIRRFMAKNTVYDTPVAGKYAFLRDARKVIPSLEYSDMEYADGVGGIRPQIIDRPNRELVMGEAKLEEDGILFNMTPSPGATNCLGNAKDDAQTIADFVDAEFDEESYVEDHQRES